MERFWAAQRETQESYVQRVAEIFSKDCQLIRIHYQKRSHVEHVRDQLGVDIQDYSSLLLKLVDGFGQTSFQQGTVENLLNGIGIISVLAKKEGTMELEVEYIATRTILKLLEQLKELPPSSANAAGNYKVSLGQFTELFQAEDRPGPTGDSWTWKDYLVYAKNPKAVSRDYGGFEKTFTAEVKLAVLQNIDKINLVLRSL